MRALRAFRVRGPLRETELVESALHPDLLRSPSQTGVNALMASGEKEKCMRLHATNSLHRSAL
jgi:hypothetical protein